MGDLRSGDRWAWGGGGVSLRQGPEDIYRDKGICKAQFAMDFIILKVVWPKGNTKQEASLPHCDAAALSNCPGWYISRILKQEINKIPGVTARQ